MKWRAIVFVWATAAVCVGLSAAVPERSLREAAQLPGLLIGTAGRPVQLSEAAYASTLAREFNMLEPENPLKCGAVHLAVQNVDCPQSDQIVDFVTLIGM